MLCAPSEVVQQADGADQDLPDTIPLQVQQAARGGDNNDDDDDDDDDGSWGAGSYTARPASEVPKLTDDAQRRSLAVTRLLTASIHNGAATVGASPFRVNHCRPGWTIS
jgi:hypothetical protein